MEGDSVDKMRVAGYSERRMSHRSGLQRQLATPRAICRRVVMQGEDERRGNAVRQLFQAPDGRDPSIRILDAEGHTVLRLPEA